MRILMVTSELHEEAAGGAGIYVYHLSKELVRQGHEVDAIAGVRYGSKLRTPFKIYKVNLNKLPIFGLIKWGIEAFVYSRRLAQGKKYDVINVHCPLGSSAFPLLYFSKTPMVITMHIGWPLTNPRYPLHQKTFSFIRDMVLGIKARKIIVLNKSFGHELSRWGVSAEKIVYIPNAVDWQRFTVGQNTVKKFRKKFRIPPQATVLLYVGRIVKGKGVERLLDAIQMIPNTMRENIWVVIVGDGSLRPSLMKEYFNVRNVLFTGFLSKSDQISAYQESDLFVIPSDGGEGMPTVLFEAMAAGLPVISTRIPGTIEVIKKEFGILVNPKDPHDLARAISNMTANEDTLRRMGYESALWGKKFDWSIIARQIAELFRSCQK